MREYKSLTGYNKDDIIEDWKANYRCETNIDICKTRNISEETLRIILDEYKSAGLLEKYDVSDTYKIDEKTLVDKSVEVVIDMIRNELDDEIAAEKYGVTVKDITRYRTVVDRSEDVGIRSLIYNEALRAGFYYTYPYRKRKIPELPKKRRKKEEER